MKIVFLGSSVTYGFASNGVSFVEYICDKNNFEYIKEAVSGTTLVDLNNDSYINRLKRIDIHQKINLFIVQLSTNDASKNLELEQIKKAVEYIIDYVSDNFKCPIMFYSNPYYQNNNYQQMVIMMKNLNRDFIFIDMYSDKTFNNIPFSLRKKYMFDDIHPTYEGYYKWVGPYIERYIKKIM